MNGSPGYREARLRCPACSGPLTPRSTPALVAPRDGGGTETVELDHCDAGHGVWVDGDELDRAHPATEALAAELDELIKAPNARRGAPCPRCTAPLIEVRFHGPQVEVCATCRGVWLSASEAEAIAAAVALARVNAEDPVEVPTTSLGGEVLGFLASALRSALFLSALGARRVGDHDILRCECAACRDRRRT